MKKENTNIVYDDGNVLITESDLDQLVIDIYEKHKDKNYYLDSGESNNIGNLLDQTEEELCYWGCDEEWVYNESRDIIEDFLYKNIENI